MIQVITTSKGMKTRKGIIQQIAFLFMVPYSRLDATRMFKTPMMTAEIATVSWI